jgi:hypothetical protein
VQQFHAKAIINAPAKVVFKTITELSSYPNFDLNCLKIDGILKEDNILYIYSKLRPKRALKVKVREIIDNEKMVWESSWPLNIFKQVKKFIVIAKDDSTSEFQIIEEFSGFLIKVFKNIIPNKNKILRQFSLRIKCFIESQPRHGKN